MRQVLSSNQPKLCSNPNKLMTLDNLSNVFSFGMEMGCFDFCQICAPNIIVFCCLQISDYSNCVSNLL